MQQTSILIWDVPVRVFHWLMVINFFIAYATGESEYWRLIHITAGYTMIGLVIFRIVWGFIGTRYAKFSSFVQSPATILKYLRSLSSKEPEHYLGHNPAGGLAILGMLGLTLMTAMSGWILYNIPGGSESWEEIHEVIANTMLGLIGLHLLGVIMSSRTHKENLVRAMITGKKNGPPNEGITRPYLILGIILFVAVFGFWLYQSQTTPPSLPEESYESEKNRD